MHSPSAPHVAHSSCLSTTFCGAGGWGQQESGRRGVGRASAVYTYAWKPVRLVGRRVTELTCGSDMARDTATRWLHDLAQFTFIYGAFFSH